MNGVTEDMSIKMVIQKELELEYGTTERSSSENGILINYMALFSVRIQMGAVIQDMRRITRGMDMGHTNGLTVGVTKGKISRRRVMAMGYADTQMELCIWENSNRAREMVMAVTDGLMGMKSMENTKMASNREMGSLKLVNNYSESSTTRANLSA
jgi:hypothetical protein